MRGIVMVLIIGLVGWVVAFLDWLGTRQDRRPKHRTRG